MWKNLSPAAGSNPRTRSGQVPRSSSLRRCRGIDGWCYRGYSRGLNEVTVHDSYNLPLIDSLLQKQAAMKVFTVLDMKEGYHQMPLAKESRQFQQ